MKIFVLLRVGNSLNRHCVGLTFEGVPDGILVNTISPFPSRNTHWLLANCEELI